MKHVSLHPNGTGVWTFGIGFEAWTVNVRQHRAVVIYVGPYAVVVNLA